jgi:hypothetical protein
VDGVGCRQRQRVIHGTCEKNSDQRLIWTITGTADMWTRLDKIKRLVLEWREYRIEILSTGAITGIWPGPCEK